MCGKKKEEEVFLSFLLSKKKFVASSLLLRVKFMLINDCGASVIVRRLEREREKQQKSKCSN